jgi:hypothetical protein
MTRRNKSDQTGLEKRARELFERSVADLDAATRTKLTQARHRALREMERSTMTREWLSLRPQAAAAVLVVVAVGVAWLLVPSRAPLVPGESLAEASDVELLLGEDELELIEDLEFYAWLEGQPEFRVDGDDGAG